MTVSAKGLPEGLNAQPVEVPDNGGEVLLKVANQFTIHRLTYEFKLAQHLLLEKQMELEKYLHSAAHIQKSLIPSRFPRVGNLEFAWRFEIPISQIVSLGVALPTTTASGFDLARETPGVTFGFLLTLEGLGHALGPAGGALFGNVEGTLVFVGALLAAAFVACLGMTPAHVPVRSPAKLPVEAVASTVEG